MRLILNLKGLCVHSSCCYRNRHRDIAGCLSMLPFRSRRKIGVNYDRAAAATATLIRFQREKRLVSCANASTSNWLRKKTLGIDWNFSDAKYTKWAIVTEINLIHWIGLAAGEKAECKGLAYATVKRKVCSSWLGNGVRVKPGDAILWLFLALVKIHLKPHADTANSQTNHFQFRNPIPIDTLIFQNFVYSTSECLCL